jgi:hypothetical protein
LTNGASVKALYKKYPNAGGYFIKLDGNARANKHLYKSENGIWYVKLAGSSSWEKVTKDDDLQKLKNTYGDVSRSSLKKQESKLASAKEIDETHKSVTGIILSWFPADGDDGPFADHKAGFFNFSSTDTTDLGGGDDEKAAWFEFKRLWNTGENSIKSKLARAQKGISNLPDGAAKRRCQTNQDLLAGIIKEGGKFHNKFMGSTSDDNFTIKLYQEDGGVYRKVVNTDF